MKNSRVKKWNDFLSIKRKELCRDKLMRFVIVFASSGLLLSAMLYTTLLNCLVLGICSVVLIRIGQKIHAGILKSEILLAISK